jgi:Ran GTPase-activating protein (RanGAP) involved in mRNA processing and transport
MITIIIERENLREQNTLFTSIMNTKGLKYLSLQSNLIYDETATYIGAALGSNTSLLELNLCNI